MDTLRTAAAKRSFRRGLKVLYDNNLIASHLLKAKGMNKWLAKPVLFLICWFLNELGDKAKTNVIYGCFVTQGQRWDRSLIPVEATNATAVSFS